MKTRCTATTRTGQPCQAWAVAGTDPPRCAPHGGGTRPVGAPKNNRNAEKHGLYSRIVAPGEAATVAGLSDDLAARLTRFSRSLDERADELPLDRLANMLDTYSQAIARLARIKRVEQTLDGGAPAELEKAVAWTLDQLSEEWMIKL